MYLRKSVFTLLLILCNVFVVVAQTTADSLALVTAHWNVISMGKGVLCREAEFVSLYGVPQHVAILEIKPEQHRFDILIHSPKEETSSAARRSPVQVKNYPIRLKGYSLIFVLSGEITIGINYLSHTLKKNTVMQVYPDDIIEHTAYSADFKGYLIIHSAELKKEIMAMTSGIRLQQAGQLKKLHTRQELSEEESLRLRKQVELIKSYIPDKEHVYHSYVIKNQIINLFFDLDNCRWHRYGDGERHQ